MANAIMLKGLGGSDPTIARGSFTLETDTGFNDYITHGLGVVPKFIAVYTNELNDDNLDGKQYIKMCVYADDETSMTGQRKSIWQCYNTSGSDTSVYKEYGTQAGIGAQYVTDSRFYLKGSSTYLYKAGITYNWIALA